MKNIIKKSFTLVLIIITIIAVAASMLISNQAISVGLSIAASVISIVVISFCFIGQKRYK